MIGSHLGPEREGLLAFEQRGTMLVAETQRLFKPRGLLLWGVTSEDLLVSGTYVGRNEQLLCSFAPVPALWWATQRSFADVVAALADGKEAAAWGSWEPVYPGMLVILAFNADPVGVKAVMWGLAI